MTVSILEQYENLFTVNSFVLDFLRSAGWWLIRGLVYLVAASETALYQIFSLKDFFQDQEVMAYFATLRPAIWVAAALAFGLLGLQYVLGRVESSKKILQNTIFAVIILSTLPMLMSIVSDLTFAAVEDMKHQPGEYFSSSILRDNITDILLYDADGFSSNLGTVNQLSEESASRINPNEIIKPQEAKNREVFQNRLTYSPEGSPSLAPLNQGFLDVIKEYYYRYTINWGTIMATLLMVAFSLILTGIKVARLLYELAFHQLFASLLAFFDIASGQRLKKVLTSIIATFSVIALIPVLLQLYLLGCSYAQTTFDGFAYLIVLISLSFALIDGPNLVQAVLGVDAGISSAFKTMAGLFYGAKTAGLALKAGGNLVGAGVRLAGNTAAGGITMASGLSGIARGAHEAMQNHAPSPVDQSSWSTGFAHGPGLPGSHYQRLGAGTANDPLAAIQPGSSPSSGSPSAVSPQGSGRNQAPGGRGQPAGQAAPPSTAGASSTTSTTAPGLAPAATAEHPADSTRQGPESYPNQYQSLGRHAADYLQGKVKGSKLYRNSVRAHEIGFNAAYGATDRTLKKREADRAKRETSYTIPPPLHLWEQPGPGQDPIVAGASSLTHPSLLTEGETDHATSDTR